LPFNNSCTCKGELCNLAHPRASRRLAA
jgi:hypothetical protein